MLDILIICGSNTKLEFICGNMLLNSNWREGHYSHYLFIWNWSNLFYKHFELGTNHANTTISSRTVWHLPSLPIHLTSIKCEIITLNRLPIRIPLTKWRADGIQISEIWSSLSSCESMLDVSMRKTFFFWSAGEREE